MFLFIRLNQDSAYEACDGTRTPLRTPLHTPKTLETCKKKARRLIEKPSRCAADRTYKATFFVFQFLWNTNILKENRVYLFVISLAQWWKLHYQKQPPKVFYIKSILKKFAKFKGNTCARVSFLINLQAPLTSLLIVLTWKSLNIVYRKLMKFFKVSPKENLKSACKR